MMGDRKLKVTFANRPAGTAAGGGGGGAPAGHGPVGSAATPGMSAVYYVVGGQGEMTIAGETVTVRPGDAVPVDLDQARSIRQTGAQPLEFMVIGIAKDLAAKAAYAATMARRPR